MGSPFPRIAAALLLVSSIASFAGCAEIGLEPDSAGVSVTEAGWTATDGYIHYAAVITNTNRDEAAKTTLSITGKDADGTVIFEEERALGPIPAGGTQFLGGAAGNGTIPDDVEFSVSVNGIRWIGTEVEEGGKYVVKDAMEKIGEYGGTQFAGKITRSGGALDSSPLP